AYLHGVHNCEFHVLDVRDLDDTIGKFDILFHAGLLYHLKNPLEHLYLMRTVAPVLVLDTHYGTEDVERLEKTSTTFEGETYEAYIYREHYWTEDPLSGMEENSLWLSRDGIFHALERFGFEVVCAFDEPNHLGPRIAVVARRSRWTQALAKLGITPR